jgi:signal transduction histidine kinase
MSTTAFVVIYMIYGLAFFSMGLAVILEHGRGSDVRLRFALRPLAAFAIWHGLHEWVEVLERLELLPGQSTALVAWQAARLMMLAFSFLSLATFGALLLASNERRRRLSYLTPIVLVSIWGAGLFLFRGLYDTGFEYVAEAWTRYTLGIPSALLASAGLVAQQRAFRQQGMLRFGRDSLWAAVGFAWYGLVGQIFVRASLLPPSDVLNQDLFLRLFGFPIQLMRASLAVVIAFFVIRFLRSFEVETQRQIEELQAARLEEAERREALRGELLRRVVGAQEAERTRIARELHDATGQSLTAIGLGLRGVTNSYTRGDQGAAEHQLRHLEDLTSNTLDELRHIIADLRPSHLDDLGLPATLRWYAKEVQGRTPIEIAVETVGQEHPLSASVSTALFRVAQEALTNILKYSEAKQTWIRLHYGLTSVTLQVEDNGCGFDPVVQARSSRSSWGLLGMQERAELLDGHFELHTGPGRGTCVQVTIPYQQPIEEAA